MAVLSIKHGIHQTGVVVCVCDSTTTATPLQACGVRAIRHSASASSVLRKGVSIECICILTPPPPHGACLLYRYVENELLGMKSLFESKEACLRQELSEERDKLAGEVGVLRQRLEQAEAGRAAAEVF